MASVHYRDGMNADPAPTIAPEVARDPWERFGWVMSSVWLVFLIFPLFAVISADTDWLWRGAAIAGLVVFGSVYVRAFIQLGRGVSLPRRRALGVSNFLGLAVLTVAISPVITWNALGLFPFLVAFASFFFTRTTGIVIIAAALALTAVGIVIGGPTVWVYPGIILLVGVTTQLVSTLDKRQAEHREMSTQVIVSAERNRVARDVHDVLGHSLTVITVKAELAERMLDVDVDRARSELVEIRALSRQALSEVRSTVGGLRAARLDDELATGQLVLADAGMKPQVYGDVSDVDPRHRTVLAWALREAVTNVVRHSKASECTISLGVDKLSVLDNGRGLDGRGPGNGIRGLSERVDGAGGSLTMSSGAQGRGTELTVQL